MEEGTGEGNGVGGGYWKGSGEALLYEREGTGVGRGIVKGVGGDVGGVMR